ncbi:MAG: 16S rRNA methyltransferase [Actinomycetaceae bacterium]|nr:16S rRNA methyltransferase [Actinomycetaceae bacterium]
MSKEKKTRNTTVSQHISSLRIDLHDEAAQKKSNTHLHAQVITSEKKQKKHHHATQKQYKHPRKSSLDAPRRVAFECIRSVHNDDAYANLLLPKLIKKAHLQRRDAAFATNLTYGTLRMQGRWDAIIALCLDNRALSDIDPKAHDILRLGAHQLLDMRTPAHAAINETVKLAREETSQSISGFVNAILRKISQKTLDEWHDIIKETSLTRTHYLSSWYSHPQWIVKELENSLACNGRNEKDIEKLLQSHNEPAHTALVPRTITQSELEKKILAAHMSSEKGIFMKNSVLLTSGAPGRLWAIQDGEVGVQDEGSQLISSMFAHYHIDGKDDAWLDMCAGPGGKTATIASLSSEKTTIFANEPFEHRLKLVEENIQPWASRVLLRCGDGRELGKSDENSFDRILVDAPCTGLGALRRRPESRWRKTPHDIKALTQLQWELLDSAFHALRPGGLLIYSTCSPVVSETHDIVHRLLTTYSHAYMFDTSDIAEKECAFSFESGKTVQLWSDLHHTDGMFIVAIGKRES